jgi:hypothetical protein
MLWNSVVNAVMKQNLRFVCSGSIVLGDISDSHDGEYEDHCLLGCCAVYSGRSLSTFQRYLLPPSSGRLTALMMEAASTSEASVNFYRHTTRRNIPDDTTIISNNVRFKTAFALRGTTCRVRDPVHNVQKMAYLSITLDFRPDISRQERISVTLRILSQHSRSKSKCNKTGKV